MTFQCKTLDYTISLKAVLGPNKIMNMKNVKFCFYFCLQYALSLTIPLYIFEFSFLKMILEVPLWAFTVKKIPVIFYNFKTK